MIHGLPPGNDRIKPGQQLSDWTFGCIALTNAEMDKVWKLVPIRMPIEIKHSTTFYFVGESLSSFSCWIFAGVFRPCSGS